LLEIENLNVSYGRGKAQVLQNITMSGSKGEITCVVGSNGAGKSTLLKSISGLIRPVFGIIRFLGKSIEGIPSQEIVDVGLIQIPEGRKIFPEMTVYENLILGAYNRNAKQNMKRNLDWVFELYPILYERKKQMAKTLSGGEQQMLTTGRALMASPKLLMLDEPSLGLAPMIVVSIFETIREINKRGVTILLVEQNVQKALKMANKGYLLENGKIVLEGSGEQILKNEFTKRAYLGL
jgi:branched-chain amino acid transport system ATP-binding protein